MWFLLKMINYGASFILKQAYWFLDKNMLAMIDRSQNLGAVSIIVCCDADQVYLRVINDFEILLDSYGIEIGKTPRVTSLVESHIAKTSASLRPLSKRQMLFRQLPSQLCRL